VAKGGGRKLRDRGTIGGKKRGSIIEIGPKERGNVKLRPVHSGEKFLKWTKTQMSWRH